MFIDEVKLTLKAGKGGDGIISWRREKYIPKGGPYGGDGGDGGDIILRATTHETTLGKFRHLKSIKADDGEKGGTQEMHGASAEDTILEVPVGTIVTDNEDGSIICDLTKPGQEFTLCEGGRGGYGNAHFPSSTRQAPNFAELGDVGDERDVKLELKLVADVGLVGLPNAGKSTVIQSITNVKPKIADYAFTTLTPNLGVMEWKGQSLVIEDIPGLIEGASEGKGLGFQFLKHIDRCRIIIHLLDASQGEELMIENYRTIRKELENWSEKMADKEELVVFSKADLIDPDQLEEMKHIFEKETGKKVTLTISAGAYIRIDELRDILIERIPKPVESDMITDGETETPEVKIYDLKTRQADPKRCHIKKRDDGDYEVTGTRIEEIARMTDTRYTDGVNRIYDVMERLSVMKRLKLLIADEISREGQGFFEGEEDFVVPGVWIAGKKFSLEGLIFMREKE
ncbi:MAG: GTPase ObgE [Candidatus Gracilibacteria bacterium]|nr:GTPase ObgE [Candidatus Gracilibacteria bacterium]